MKRSKIIDNITLSGSTQESSVFQFYSNQFSYQLDYTGTSLSLKVLTSVDGVNFVENTDLSSAITANSTEQTRVQNVVKGEFAKIEFIGDGVLTVTLLR